IGFFSLVTGALGAAGFMAGNKYIACAISLALEMTTGFEKSSSLGGGGAYIFTGAGIGFSGGCLIMQQTDHISKADLPLKRFFLGKLLQTAVCAVLGWAGGVAVG
ncbi:MAG: hypothetical protein GX061_03715, partial [Eubacteriaceae bacterium]|nr:hypothetical protein [Eubacteriaceae bacterium]